MLGEDLAGFLIASRSTDDGVRIVMAGAEWVSGPGELVRVYPGGDVAGARLTKADLNGGTLTRGATTVPRFETAMQLQLLGQGHRLQDQGIDFARVRRCCGSGAQ